MKKETKENLKLGLEFMVGLAKVVLPPIVMMAGNYIHQINLHEYINEIANHPGTTFSDVIYDFPNSYYMSYWKTELGELMRDVGLIGTIHGLYNSFKKK